ncbi:MAG: hypothetical protein GY851_06255, partial [bacterium]|nr:hypothetical protein [bacterium]
MTDANETFDLEKIYDDEITPLMKQIIAICRKHRMPMLASFLYEHNEDGGLSTCDTIIQYEGRNFGCLNRALGEVRGQTGSSGVHIRTMGPDGAVIAGTRKSDGRPVWIRLVPDRAGTEAQARL